MVTNRNIRWVVVVLVIAFGAQNLSANELPFHIEHNGKKYYRLLVTGILWNPAETTDTNFLLLATKRDAQSDYVGFIVPASKTKTFEHANALRHAYLPYSHLLQHLFYLKFLHHKHPRRILLNPSESGCGAEIHYHPPKIEPACTNNVVDAVTVAIVEAYKRNGKLYLYADEVLLQELPREILKKMP